MNGERLARGSGPEFYCSNEVMPSQGEVLHAMQQIAPAGQAELAPETSARLLDLTRTLVALNGEHAMQEYDRYTGTSERRLTLPEAELHEQLADKTILVTGGTGLIGTALLNELVRYQPAKLVSVSRGVTEPVQTVPDVAYLYADMADKAALSDIIKEVQPDIIYHLAADKYNHLAESRARHTLRTNVLGTQNLIDAAQAANVPQIVYASTGKATRPYSPDVYASSKKTGEWLMTEAAKNSDGLYSGVRFTHVVDGSNISRKLEQSVSNGEPVRLHDPDIWFYVQSAQESAQLLLLAGLEAEPGKMKLAAINNLGLPINLLELGLGVVAKREAQVPIYFCGVEAGYEEKAWPGLYDLTDGGEVSPLINALEAPQTEVSKRCPEVDIFQLQHEPTEALYNRLTELTAALGTPTETSTENIREHNHELSWALLEATLLQLPRHSLERAAKRVEQRLKRPDYNAVLNPDHARTDIAILTALQKRQAAVKNPPNQAEFRADLLTTPPVAPLPAQLNQPTF